MEGFKKGFYITSLKKQRKPKANLRQSSFTQHQLFYQQSQQPGEQQNHEERKQTHVPTPMSEEKPRKQTKSALHQVVLVQPFWLDEHDQLIKVILDLQKEVKKLRKDNEKLMQQLSLAERIEPRLMFQERELSAF